MRSSIVPLITLLAACDAGISGDGQLKSESRTVGSFRAVSIASGFNALVSLGPQGVTLRTDENILPFVETFVQGESLVVRVKPGTVLVNVAALEVAVSNDKVEGVDASGGSIVNATATPIGAFQVDTSGGSQVHVDQLASSSIQADASGGSGITLSGTAKSAAASASGGSSIDLKAITLDSLSLDASGGSDVFATVATSVTGNASGGSTVNISGNPSMNVDSSGGSEVSASH
jgi:hypothetical protein